MAVLVKESTRNLLVNELAYNLYDACDCLRCLDCVVEFIDIWTRDHYVYVSDGDEMEVISTPEYMVQQIVDGGSFGGDCDDVSVFVAALYKCLGMKTRFVAIKVQQKADFSHVFVEVLSGDRWVMVDPTVPPDTVHIDFGRMVQYV